MCFFFWSFFGRGGGGEGGGAFSILTVFFSFLWISPGLEQHRPCTFFLNTSSNSPPIHPTIRNNLHQENNNGSWLAAVHDDGGVESSNGKRSMLFVRDLFRLALFFVWGGRGDS